MFLAYFLLIFLTLLRSAATWTRVWIFFPVFSVSSPPLCHCSHWQWRVLLSPVDVLDQGPHGAHLPGQLRQHLLRDPAGDRPTPDAAQACRPRSAAELRVGGESLSPFTSLACHPSCISLPLSLYLPPTLPPSLSCSLCCFVSFNSSILLTYMLCILSERTSGGFLIGIETSNSSNAAFTPSSIRSNFTIDCLQTLWNNNYIIFKALYRDQSLKPLDQALLN